jgi:hypothetical protein
VFSILPPFLNEIDFVYELPRHDCLFNVAAIVVYIKQRTREVLWTERPFIDLARIE